MGGDLEIRRNRNMVTICASCNLPIEAINGSAVFSGNANLSNLTGFTRLASIGNNLEVYNNPLMLSLGFENLEAIGGNLYIHGNMADFSSLTSLR